MPAAAIAVPAAIAVAGMIAQHKSANNAKKENLTAQGQALAYEREKDAARKKEYDEAKGIYQQQQQFAWKMRQGVLGRYGIHLPDMPQNGPQGTQVTAGAIPRPPVTLGTIASAGPPTGQMAAPGGMPAQTPPMGAPGDTLDNWNDWRKYAAVP